MIVRLVSVNFKVFCPGVTKLRYIGHIFWMKDFWKYFRSLFLLKTSNSFQALQHQYTSYNFTHTESFSFLEIEKMPYLWNASCDVVWLLDSRFWWLQIYISLIQSSGLIINVKNRNWNSRYGMEKEWFWKFGIVWDFENNSFQEKKGVYYIDWEGWSWLEFFLDHKFLKNPWEREWFW